MSPAAAALAAGRRAAAVRHEVTGTLEAVTALRVGGWGPSAAADLVVARDGLGRAVIPGTSLAGAMRAWLGSVRTASGDALFGPADLGRVFGDLEHRGRGGEVCRISVGDAVAEDDIAPAIRDGAGIDRAAGAAAAGILYQQEVMPLGTPFGIKILAVQAGGDSERVGEALELLLAALTAGRVEIGAARTRGLGQVRLTGMRRTRVDLTDRGQVLAWLCGQAPPGPEAEPAGSAPLADGRLGIEVTWSAVTPVMVRASTVNEPEPEPDRAVDIVPLRAASPAQDGDGPLLMPGSSVKGVLRSHAERIVRTLWRLDLPGPWLDQVNDPRLAVIRSLFGMAGDDPEPGYRGALSVHDCVGVAVAERVVTHVAVDRWTGGAAENLLFSVREPAAADWEPIRMSLDTRRARGPGDDEGALALALLLLTLRDLADGWLTLGFGGTRGRGSVGVSQVAFSEDKLPEPWSGLCGRTLAEVIADPPGEVGQALTAWREAVPS